MIHIISKRNGVLVAGTIILLMFFFIPFHAASATACKCPNSDFPNACPSCAAFDITAPYCIDAQCTATGPVITGTKTDINFDAPTAMTSFSDLICAIIGFINTTLLPPITVFMTLLAGFFFMLSGQSPQKAITARRILLYTTIGIVLFLLAPGIVALIASILGATGAFSPISCSASMSANTVTNVIIKLVNWFAWFVSLASVAMGLYAGFLYLTSRGDPRKVQQATKTLSYTIIGIAVAILAFSIISIVKVFLG